MLEARIKYYQSEEELVKLIKYDDNNEALILLLSIYKPIIISKINSFFFNECDFEDIYQECVIALYRIIFDFSAEKSSFRTFASICLNRVLISLKRNKSTKSIIPEDIIELDESLIADSETPEVIFERYDNYDILLSKIRAKLSNREYSVLLQLVEGISYSEISSILGISTKSVDNAVQRIRKKFSDMQ